MFKLFIEQINHSKGKITLALAKFHTWAFILSVVLFIVAGISAYSVYSEGKIAQSNAQELLEAFEQELLKVETSKPIQIERVLSNTTEVEQPEPIVPSNLQTEKKYQIDAKPQIEAKPQIKAKPIAKIHIKKVGLSLSVLSEWSYDLLKVSVCKFSGPEPNEQGNFIIIGHNYLDGAHFGNLSLLENGDLMDLTDLTGRKKIYEVYEILTINPDEVDKLTTNEACAVTLVTCKSEGSVRLVIKCKEVSLNY